MVYFQMLGSSKSCISSRVQFPVEIVYHHHTLFEDADVFSIGEAIASFQMQLCLKSKASILCCQSFGPG